MSEISFESMHEVPTLPSTEYYKEPFNEKVIGTFWTKKDPSDLVNDILTIRSAVYETVKRMKDPGELMALVDYVENRLTPKENESGFEEYEFPWGKPQQVVALEDGIVLGVLGKATDISRKVRQTDWVLDELAMAAHRDMVNAAIRCGGVDYADYLKERHLAEQRTRIEKLEKLMPGHKYLAESIIK